MTFHGTIALVGLSLVAGGVQSQYGLAAAAITVGAVMVAVATVDAIAGRRGRGTRG